jgi:hypothetical protein
MKQRAEGRREAPPPHSWVGGLRDDVTDARTGGQSHKWQNPSLSCDRCLSYDVPSAP